MQQNSTKQYLINSFTLLIKAIPFLLLYLMEQSFIIVDKSLTNSLGIAAINAFGTIMVLSWCVNAFSYNIQQGYVILLAQNKYKDDSNAEEIKTLNSSAMILTMSITFVIVLGIFLGAGNIAKFLSMTEETTTIFKNIARIGSIYYLIMAYSYLIDGYMLVRRKQKILTICTIITGILNIFFDLISIYLGWGAVGIITGTVISTAMKCIIVQCISQLKFGKPSWNILKKVCKLSKDLIIQDIFHRICIICCLKLASNLGEISYAIYNVIETIIDIYENIYWGLATSVDVWIGECISGIRDNQNKIYDKYLNVNKQCLTFIALSEIALQIFYFATLPLCWFLFKGTLTLENPEIVLILFIIVPIYNLILNFEYIHMNFMRAFKELKIQYILSIISGVICRCGILVTLNFLGLLNSIKTIYIILTFDHLIRAIIQYLYMNHKYEKKFTEGIIHFRKGGKYDITL